MDKVITNKTDLELVTSCSSVTKQVQKSSFLNYILSDQVWWCNIKQFLSYSKNYICNLFKPIHDINYSTSTYPFESRICGKEGKRLHKFEHLENEKSFLDEMKNIFFIVFEGLSFWEKIKLDKKTVDASFKK